MAPNLSALQTLVEERLLVAAKQQKQQQQQQQQQATNTSEESQRIPSLLQRHGNVDTFYSASEEQDVALCHLFALFPFTDGDDKRPWNKVGFYEGVAAMMLAMDHLNTGNGSIIPEIESSSASNCPLRFSFEITDTTLRESVATENAIQATNRPFDSSSQIHPCAFVGAARSAVSIPTSIVTGLRGYPQISPISTSSALNDNIQFPLFARTIPSDDGTAVPLVLYFRDVLKLKYLAVIHINDTYGNSYAQGIQAAALEFAPDMVVQSVDIPVEATPEVVERAVNFLRETQYAFVFGIVWSLKLFDEVLIEAHRQGIAGTGNHHWIFSEVSGNDILSRQFPRGSPLQKALLGSSVISASGGREEFNPRLRLLTNAMKEIKEDPQNLEFILDSLPLTGFDVYAPDYLESPGLVGAFLYDATVVMGISACHAWNKNNNNINNNNETHTTVSFLNGVDHFASLVQTTFAGTSGDVVLDSITGTRTSKSAFFQLENYIVDEDRSFDTRIQYKGVLIDLFSDGEWQKIADYVFNDGTTNIPPDIPPNNVKPDTFSTGIRAGGLIMCGLAVMLALGFAAWTWKNRTHRVLAASQPIFLYLICTGVIVAVLVIVPLSIDEQVATVRGCSIACQSIPWLLSMGFSLIFSALFTKTWRINKIFAGGMQLRRVTLKPWHVAQPMFALMGANLVILTIWTVRAPLYWDYKVVREDIFFRPVELYGHCNSDGDLPYKISLACLNMMALLFALVAAYEARNISTQYAETEYIFLAIAVILIVCLLGVPVLVLARENPDAYFFVFSGIVFTVCMSVLCLIFIPKVHFYRVACQEGSTKSAVFAAATSGYLRDWMAKGPESQLLPESSVDDMVPLVVDSDINDDLMMMVGGEEKGSSQQQQQQQGLRILSKKTKRELILEVTMMRERLNQDLRLEKSRSVSNNNTNFTSAANRIPSQIANSSKVSSTPNTGAELSQVSSSSSSEAASIEESGVDILSGHDMHSSSLIMEA